MHKLQETTGPIVFQRLTSSPNEAGAELCNAANDSDLKVNNAAFAYYSRLKKLRDYVGNHHMENISLQRAAKIAGLEKKYFSTFFRRKVGITYIQWLHSFRVEKAVELIKANDDPLIDIASASGFGDLRTFERSFKKVMKVTPAKFRMLIRPS